jgi:hypothetical protein
MAENTAGEGRQTIQQPTINGSLGGMVTLVEAEEMVTVEAMARARQWQRWGYGGNDINNNNGGDSGGKGKDKKIIILLLTFTDL